MESPQEWETPLVHYPLANYDHVSLPWTPGQEKELLPHTVGLSGKLVFAELFETVAKAALKRSGRVGIEGDEIPERLAAIFAKPSKGACIGIRMAGDIFANGAVRMLGEFVQRFCVGARMLADQAQEIEIFLGGLLDELFEHFGLRVGAENEANLFVPGGVDL